MAQQCCVSGCSSGVSAGIETEVKFYRLPRDVNLSCMWRKKLGLAAVDTSSRVCSLHFSEDDFMLTNLGWKTLLSDAVPSQHLPGSDSSKAVPVRFGAKVVIKQEAAEGASSSHSQEPSNCMSTQEKLKIIFEGLRAESAEEHDVRNRGNVSDLSLKDKCHNESFEVLYDSLFPNAVSFLCSSYRHVYENYVCNECGWPSLSFNEHLLHVNSHVKFEIFNCVLCYLKFSSKALYLEHCLAHWMWCCYNCFEGFSSKDTMLYHVSNFHSGKENIFICSYCGRRFSSYLHLNCHLGTHDGEKMSYCRICGICVLDTRGLEEHFHSHVNCAKMSCELCGQRFLSVEVFEAHKAIHIGNFCMENIKKFKKGDILCCHLCGAYFESLQFWKNHLQFHMKNMEFILLTQRELSRLQVPSCSSEKEFSLSCSLSIKSEKTEETSFREHEPTDQIFILKCEKDVSANELQEVCYGDYETDNAKEYDNDKFNCIECGERCGSSSRLALHYEMHVKEEPGGNWSSEGESSP